MIRTNAAKSSLKIIRCRLWITGSHEDIGGLFNRVGGRLRGGFNDDERHEGRPGQREFASPQ